MWTAKTLIKLSWFRLVWAGPARNTQPHCWFFHVAANLFHAGKQPLCCPAYCISELSRHRLPCIPFVDKIVLQCTVSGTDDSKIDENRCKQKIWTNPLFVWFFTSHHQSFSYKGTGNRFFYTGIYHSLPQTAVIHLPLFSRFNKQ